MLLVAVLPMASLGKRLKGGRSPAAGLLNACSFGRLSLDLASVCVLGVLLRQCQAACLAQQI